jgi:hypothetical protein
MLVTASQPILYVLSPEVVRVLLLQTCVRGKPSLLRAVTRAYGAPYYRLAILKVTSAAATTTAADHKHVRPPAAKV